MRRSEFGMLIDLLLYFKRGRLSSKLEFADFGEASSRGDVADLVPSLR
jgi:hypothetical protein